MRRVPSGIPGARPAVVRPCRASPVARSSLNSVDGEEWHKLSVEDIDSWAQNGPSTPLLDTVNFPVHMKNFNMQQLQQLCKELRSDIVHTVSRTGGHLSSSLGVVELTVAMHYVFNCPEDKFIWDVGHQAYGHKILTGRRKKMHTIRQTGGLSGACPRCRGGQSLTGMGWHVMPSCMACMVNFITATLFCPGFTKREESEYDAFGAGHSSTSISAGLGMAVGRDFKNKNNHVVSVIGDGAITGGMAYEAMNHAGKHVLSWDTDVRDAVIRIECVAAEFFVERTVQPALPLPLAGFLDKNMIVILNDNQQVRPCAHITCCCAG
eukprot:352550-Chlamydomonas_euryale.AAC.11